MPSYIQFHPAPQCGVERMLHHPEQNKNTYQSTEWNHRTALNNHNRMKKQPVKKAVDTQFTCMSEVDGEG